MDKFKTKKAKMILKAITSKKFQKKNKKVAVYVFSKYLFNYDTFSFFQHILKRKNKYYSHRSFKARCFWELIFWIFENREWRLINVLEDFLNQYYLDAFHDDCEDRNDHIDAITYWSYFQKLNIQQKCSCIFRIYEQLLDLNSELSCPKTELYLAYEHNFRKPFRPERYFYFDDPEVKICFLLILSLIYPEINNFVKRYNLNKINNKDNICKQLNIDRTQLKNSFKFLYADMGIIHKFYPEITIDYIKFFSFLNKKQVLKYL
ncbi:hypothetical protein JCM12298_08140 [Desulfothermus naphthae]